MSIIADAEKYMKRYDYLMDKRERKYKEGTRLRPDEDDELQKLRPNVFTPIFMMFELLHDTVKTNQENRQSSNRIKNQTGGAESQGNVADATATSEARRLSELEESLLPLLTKIILYIEENKKVENKKDGNEANEDEKYPDIGTSAKNSAILVVRRIKKWWNDLIAGGTSDLSSKINLKKMIPQLANNPDDMNNLIKMDEMNKLADKATDAIHGPLQKIEKILSNDVRDIASSSVEGIMNALSLIPGIGTTLQLWRLLQNVVVIMSKSVTTMADTKTVGVNLKDNVEGIKAEFEKLADPNAIANAAAKSATDSAMSQVSGAVANQAGALAAANPIAAGPDGVMPQMPSVEMPSVETPQMPQVKIPQMPQLGQTGGGAPRKTSHLRSIKKYKREYKQSIRDIRKTRKNILRCIKNMI